MGYQCQNTDSITRRLSYGRMALVTSASSSKPDSTCSGRASKHQTRRYAALHELIPETCLILAGTVPISSLFSKPTY